MFVFFLFLFILLSSEKNEPRSAAAVIGPRRSQTAPSSWAAELASGSDNPRPVPSSRLARSLPDKGGILRPFYPFPPHVPLPPFSHRFLPLAGRLCASVIPRPCAESRKYSREEYLQWHLSEPCIKCGVTRYVHSFWSRVYTHATPFWIPHYNAVSRRVIQASICTPSLPCTRCKMFVCCGGAG